STSLSTVPTGTYTILSSPLLPIIFLPCPFSPSPARQILSTDSSDLTLLLATTITLPPLPPDPPSGPPLSINLSLLNEIAPSPPFPACATKIFLSIKRGRSA